MYATDFGFGSVMVRKIDLTMSGDFKLVIIHESNGDVNRRKRTIKYVRAIIVEYKGRVLINDYVGLTYMKNYLKLYTSKHLITNEPNAFFKLSTKQNGYVTCRFDEERHLYRAEANTMLDLMNQALLGFDKAHLFMHTTSDAITISSATAKMIEKDPTHLFSRFQENSDEYVQSLIDDIGPIVTNKSDD